MLEADNKHIINFESVNHVKPKLTWMDEFKTDNIQNKSIGYVASLDRCIILDKESKK